MSDLVRFHRAHGELCLRAGLLAAARRAYAAAYAAAAAAAYAAADAYAADARIKTKASVLAIVRKHFPKMPERSAK